MRQLVGRVAVAVALVVAFALPAFATPVPEFHGGKVEFKLESKDGSQYSLTQNAVLNLRYNNVSGSKDGVSWRLDVELGNIVGSNLSLGKYRLTTTDPRFTVAVWGKGYDHEDKKAPFDGITAVKKSDNHALRVTSGPVLVDVRKESSFDRTTIFVEQGVSGLTVGAAVQHQNHGLTHQNLYGAYVKGDIGGLLTKTEVAVYSRSGTHADVSDAKAEGQFIFGAKTTVPLIPRFSAELETIYKGENWGNELKVQGALVHDNAAIGKIKVTGAHVTETDADPQGKEQSIALDVERSDYKVESKLTMKPAFADSTSRTAFVQLRYRTTTKIGYGDLFKKWNENDGMAYGVRFDNEVTSDIDKPKNTIAVDAGGKLTDRLWVSANATIQSDEDANVSLKVKDGSNSDKTVSSVAKSTMSVEAKARYDAQQNVWLNPWVRFASATKASGDSNTLMAAGVDVEYKVDKLTYTLGLGAGKTNIDDVEQSQSRVLLGAVFEF